LNVVLPGCIKLSSKECALSDFYKALHSADRNDYIDDIGEFMEDLSLEGFSNSSQNHRILYGNGGSARHYIENLIPDYGNKKQIYHIAETILCGGTLREEFNRIYEGSKSRVLGHPVHYLVEIDDCRLSEDVVQLLLCALYKNKRIDSLRYTRCRRIDNNNELDILKYYYFAAEGGSVIIDLLPEREFDEDEYSANSDNIFNLCKMIRENKNNVLSIICIPQGHAKLKNEIYNQLDDISLVEIFPDAVNFEIAKNYVLGRLEEKDIDTTNMPELSEDKSYTISDLNKIVDDFITKYIRTEVYPQYSKQVSAASLAVKQAPKGSAYERLQKMIGLAEAKRVIDEILDFYKVRKLYQTKGINQDHPCRHMVFTGNPGTAKTTVARLFAEIMKDNHLLSVGNLYEVGRSDLVGKYVGWTAQIVKEKFKKAKGSVLFIDEAYSLCEGKEGLYGDEAINTIVQELENNREDIVVIFAGYPDKMEEFLSKNPGLRSRIAFNVPFEDYSVGELYAITKLMADEKEYTLEVEIEELLQPIYEKAMKDPEFGNGRYVRNIFEKALMKQAGRLVKLDPESVTKDDLLRLTTADFDVTLPQKPHKRSIGF
jgi:AAA+ superfamily predicted ATPase